MSYNSKKCIFSFGDIETIRLIMKCMAEKDIKGLATVPGVKRTEDEYFWPCLDECGTEFEEPPPDFFDLWHMQFIKDKSTLGLEGPMWGKDQGPTDWYLYLEKHVDANPPYIYIKGYGST